MICAGKNICIYTLAERTRLVKPCNSVTSHQHAVNRTHPRVRVYLALLIRFILNIITARVLGLQQFRFSYSVDWAQKNKQRNYNNGSCNSGHHHHPQQEQQKSFMPVVSLIATPQYLPQHLVLYSIRQENKNRIVHDASDHIRIGVMLAITITRGLFEAQMLPIYGPYVVTNTLKQLAN